LDGFAFLCSLFAAVDLCDQLRKSWIVADRREIFTVKVMRLVLVAKLDGFIEPFERKVFFTKQGICRADPKGRVVIRTRG